MNDTDSLEVEINIVDNTSKVLKIITNEAAGLDRTLKGISAIDSNVFIKPEVSAVFKKVSEDLQKRVETIAHSMDTLNKEYHTGQAGEADVQSQLTSKAAEIDSIKRAVTVMEKTIAQSVQTMAKFDEITVTTAKNAVGVLKQEYTLQNSISKELQSVNKLLATKSGLISQKDVTSLTQYRDALLSLEKTAEFDLGGKGVFGLNQSELKNFSGFLDEINGEFIGLKGSVRSVMVETSSFNTTGMVAQIKSAIATINTADTAVLKYDKNIHELQRSINSAKTASPTSKANANAELEKMRTDSQATIALVTRLKEALRATGVEYQELVKNGQANSDHAKALLKVMGAQELELKNTMTRANLDLAQQGKVVASLKDELTKLDRVEWFKNIAKRAGVYYSLYQAQQLVLGAFKNELQYIVDIDTANRTFAALSGVRGEYNEKLLVGKAIEESLIATALEYGASLKEVNSVGMALLRAGIPQDKIKEVTESVILLAKLTGDTIESSSSAMVTYTTVYGEMAAESGRATLSVEELGAKLAYLANQSRMTTTDISTFSNYALASGTAVGLTIDAIDAMAISLNNAGFGASTVGTQIQKFANVIISSSNDVKSFWSNINVNQDQLIADIQAGGETSNKAFSKVISQFRNMSNEQFTMYIRDMDINEKKVLNALRNNADAVQKHLNGSLGTKPEDLDDAKKITEGYNATIEKLKMAFLELGRALVGGSIPDAINTMGQAVASTVGFFRLFIESVYDIVEVVAKGGVLSVGLMGLIGVVGLTSFAVNNLTTSLVALGVAAKDNWITLAIGTTVAAVMYFNNEEEKLVTTTKAAEDAQKNFATAIKSTNDQLMENAGWKYRQQAIDELNASYRNYEVMLEGGASYNATYSDKEMEAIKQTLEYKEKLIALEKKIADMLKDGSIKGELAEIIKKTKETEVQFDDFSASAVYDIHNVSVAIGNIITPDTVTKIKQQLGEIGESLKLGNYMNFDQFKPRMNALIAEADAGGEKLKSGLFDKIKDTDIATQLGADITNMASKDIQVVARAYADAINQLDAAAAKGIPITQLKKDIETLASARLGIAKQEQENQNIILENNKKRIDGEAEISKASTGGNKIANLGIEIKAKRDLLALTTDAVQKAKLNAEIATLEATKAIEGSKEKIKSIETEILLHQQGKQASEEDLRFAVAKWESAKKLRLTYEETREVNQNAEKASIALSTLVISNIQKETKELIKQQKAKMEALSLTFDEASALREIAQAQAYSLGIRTDLLEAESSYSSAIEATIVANKKLALAKEYLIALEIELKRLKEANASKNAITDVETKIQEQKNEVLKDQNDIYRAQAKEIKALRDAEITRIKNSDDFVAGWQLANAEFLRNAKTTAEQAMEVYGALTSSMTSGFENFFDMTSDGFMDFGKLATSILQDVYKAAVRAMIVQPLVNGIMGAFTGGVTPSTFGNLYTGPTSAVSTSTSAPIYQFANGDAFNSPSLSQHSNTVVDKPTFFAFASGGVPNLGVMGEAGSEAIMPLTRTASGDLGVKATQSAPTNMKIEVINNSSQQVEVTNVQQKFDSEGMILSIVINGIQKNKMGIRDMLGGGK